MLNQNNIHCPICSSTSLDFVYGNPIFSSHHQKYLADVKSAENFNNNILHDNGQVKEDNSPAALFKRRLINIHSHISSDGSAHVCAGFHCLNCSAYFLWDFNENLKAFNLRSEIEKLCRLYLLNKKGEKKAG